MLKRSFDVIATALVMPVLLPVMGVIALLIRVRMGRPILFRQERLGRGGERFKLVKFRTMSDGRGPDGELLPDDERLAALGRRLRSTSLDELPEFFHVLAGTMSLVGPRPLPAVYENAYSSHHWRRHEVRPGITGLAQVTGRNDVTWENRLNTDVEYVETHTIWLDLQILARTVRTIVKREGISAEGHATMPSLLQDPAADIDGTTDPEAGGDTPVTG